MMGNVWAGRLGILIVLIIVQQASTPLAVFLVAFAGITGVLFPIYKGGYLPRFIMDVLDRLSNKESLQKAYEAKHRQLTAINAEELAEKLKARVIGQNVVIDRIAVQLRRRLAGRRKDKPIAVFCLAARRASARRIWPRCWRKRSMPTKTICISLIWGRRRSRWVPTLYSVRPKAI